MAYFDIKVSVWQRTEIPDNVKLEDVIEYFKKNTGTSCINEIGIDDSTYETLVESEEILTPEDNGGECTVEIYNDHSNLVWNNKPQ